MTESGGTTGMSFCMIWDRLERIWVVRDREGLVMMAWGLRDQI